MSGSSLIIPGRVGPDDEDMKRFELPSDDHGSSRYVSLQSKATLGGYFDDVFVRVLAMTKAQGPMGLMAHGCQVVWVFAAQAYSSVQTRLRGVDSRLDDLTRLVKEQGAEIEKLRSQLTDAN